MSVEIRHFEESQKSAWDAFVRTSRNGLFIFERDYMEYHANRFQDSSLTAWQDGKLVAVLPASINRESGLVISHGGLTFGGLIVSADLRSTDCFPILSAMLAELRQRGGSELEVRLLPTILMQYPAAELDYEFWRLGFQLVRRDLSTALPVNCALPFKSVKKRAVQKAQKAGLQVGSGSIDDFHRLLAEVLEWRHGVTPVHSIAELELLMSRFPNNIVLRSVVQDGNMLAGVLVYRYGTAWHTQYMASSQEGRKLGALDLIIAELIKEAQAGGVPWLSFGTSTTDAGKSLNEGLLWQKESFGGRSVTHDFWRGAL